MNIIRMMWSDVHSVSCNIELNRKMKNDGKSPNEIYLRMSKVYFSNLGLTGAWQIWCQVYITSHGKIMKSCCDVMYKVYMTDLRGKKSEGNKSRDYFAVFGLILLSYAGFCTFFNRLVVSFTSKWYCQWKCCEVMYIDNFWCMLPTLVQKKEINTPVK